MSSRRAKAPTTASVSPSVRLGLTTLCEGNEGQICQMLSLASDTSNLEEELLKCMGVNSEFQLPVASEALGCLEGT